METTQLVLRREAQRARYRHAWWIALAAGAGGNALLVLAMWASVPRAPAPSVNVMPPPAPIVLASPVAPPVIVVVPPAAPAPAPATFGDLGPCPATYAARPPGALRQPGDQELTHVTGAPTDSRWIAAWNDHDVFVSRDGGASWDEVLDGPGRVLSASFDCHGRALVLREETGLGVRDGVREAWRAVPSIDLRVSDAGDGYLPRYQAAIAGGGRSLAVIGQRRGDEDGDGDGDGEAWAAISDDGGLTWRHAALGWYEGVATAAWRGDTLRVLLPWTDCSYEGTRLVTVTGGGQTSEELGEWSRMVGLDRGTPYVLSESCDADTALCAWRVGRDWRALAPAPVEARGEDGVITELLDGPTDVVIRNDVAQTLSGVHLGRARTLPDGFEALGTDRAGRIWGRDADGRLARR